MTLSTDWAFNQLHKLHKQQPKLVDDAMQQIINNNPELTWSLVVSAYLDEEVSLGKAAEMLGVHKLELKEKFVNLGIPLRVGPADIAEARAEVSAVASWFTKD